MRVCTVQLLLFCILSVKQATARTWRDIVPLHGLEVRDDSVFYRLGAENPLFTAVPSSSPSSAPSSSPSAVPTASPMPSMSPTITPTTSPSSSPSAVPTVTPDPFPANDPPSNPERGYFNYDTTPDAQYGPGYAAVTTNGGKFNVEYRNNKWGSVDTPSNNYWAEFGDKGEGPWKGVLAKHDVNRNRCNNVGNQSPIDVRDSGATCHEFHEVRSLRGDYRIGDGQVTKVIEHNKLRVIYPRRPCGDWNNIACSEPDPPYADFPNGWGGYADVMHIDIKVPSEHLINGERFDAEMQIFHLHASRRRMPTLTVMIRARDDGYNYYFQDAVDAFDTVYRQNQARCAVRQRHERRMKSEFESSIGYNATKYHGVNSDWDDDYSIPTDNPTFDQELEQSERKLNVGFWDPHHAMLVPTIHFFRYEGSLTEPPCSEWVSWFVADKPMIVSFEQLERLKTMLFLNVDENCRPTSSQSGHSVARPIQETAGRPVWQCTERDFGPDR